MAIEIIQKDTGLILPVRAQPGAKRNCMVGEHGGALKVAVQAPPEDGKANDAITDLLRKSFGISKQQIELLSGHTSRDKKFLITGITLEQLQAKITALLSDV